jgi:hypothetical protein
LFGTPLMLFVPLPLPLPNWLEVEPPQAAKAAQAAAAMSPHAEK